MDDKVRELHTGLYSDRAEMVMRLLLNSEQNYQSLLKKTFKVKSFLYLKVKRAIDNEVVFTCGKFRGRGWGFTHSFSGVSDDDALNHIAWCFKQCVLSRLLNKLSNKDKAKENWNRSSALYFRTEFSAVDISVPEAYFIYDIMRQRKNAAKRYSKKLSESLIGLPLDPIMSEMKSGMLEEIKRIKNECENAKLKLYHDKEDTIKKYCESIEAQCNESLNALNKETADKIAKIKAEMAALATT